MGNPARSRKVSTWRSVQGIATTARDSYGRPSRRNSREDLSPWAFDNWSFDPAKISIYGDAGNKRHHKPGDAFSNREELISRPLVEPLLTPLRVATGALLLLSGGLVIFIITQFF